MADKRQGFMSRRVIESAKNGLQTYLLYEVRLGPHLNVIVLVSIYVTGSEKRAHFAQDFKIELVVL